MMNMSPLMLAQIALERPDLLASQMASMGKAPPAVGLNIQTASGPRGPVPADTTGGVPPAAWANAGQQPAQPGLAPLTQQMMTPQPAMPAPAAMPSPREAGAMGPQMGAAPTAVPPAAPAAPATDPLAAALAGVAPSMAGGGQPQRVSLAPAPFIPSALNPQTLQILQAALAQPTTGVPSLGALIGGGR